MSKDSENSISTKANSALEGQTLDLTRRCLVLGGTELVGLAKVIVAGYRVNPNTKQPALLRQGAANPNSKEVGKVVLFSSRAQLQELVRRWHGHCLVKGQCPW